MINFEEEALSFLMRLGALLGKGACFLLSFRVASRVSESHQTRLLLVMGRCESYFLLA